MAEGDFAETDTRDILIDDESYFTFTGASLPGNVGFYTSNFDLTNFFLQNRENGDLTENAF